MCDVAHVLAHVERARWPSPSGLDPEFIAHAHANGWAVPQLDHADLDLLDDRRFGTASGTSPAGGSCADGLGMDPSALP
ncbi:hypothetical protein FDA94_09740 [Herbidospora galbida]|uniref:Uncharacterized protein n=1 Tax=Herbidospora galbida TaxID=2575442 RepID=A0A4U3MMK4_9ACTN|nr:hypothetical protein [Herbidospora galbida]TKK89216.1 hypothetical protein FDA94_09740 [Herbidospora galbida]